MARLFSAACLCTALVLLTAAPVLANSSKASLEGARRSMSTQAEVARPVGAVPEPSAALLFAVGAGSLFWKLRRRPRR